MTASNRTLSLGAFLMATGHHVAAWRHPDVPADAGLSFQQYKRLAQIAEDGLGFEGEKWLITLGDHIDRGPHSRAAIEHIMGPPPRGFRRFSLLGNHEAMLIEAVDEGEWTPWLQNGGEETVASYDHARPPVEHLKWLRRLPVCARDADRFYVHAGFRPGVAIVDQDEEACLWIRGKFLNADGRELPGHVVHGHTPVHTDKPEMDQPERLPHRTNLDTGACWTGVLGVGLFEPGRAEPIEILRVR